jgi:hypothetical protein
VLWYGEISPITVILSPLEGVPDADTEPFDKCVTQTLRVVLVIRGFEYLIPGFLPGGLWPWRRRRVGNHGSKVCSQLLCRRVVVTEENDLLPLLDGGSYDCGDGPPSSYESPLRCGVV